MRPCISVILIFLDAEEFISKSIESVIAQSLPDWELLLVDDGSADGSSQIARRYHQLEPERIRYLEHPGHANRGTAASRNLGMDAARGEFVAFLDADDIYLPSRLESHVRILRQLPEIGMVQSEHVRWHTWNSAGRPGNLYLPRFWPSMGDSILHAPTALTMLQAVPYLLPGICDITVRRSVAASVKGFEGRFRVLYEDQSFICKIYLQHTVYVLRSTEALYRRHDSSLTMRAIRGVGRVDDDVVSGRDFDQWLNEYVANSSVQDRALLRQLALRDQRAAGVGNRVRRSLRRAMLQGRAGALRMGAAGLYRWLLLLEHQLMLRRAEVQYVRYCSQVGERLMLDVSQT